MKYRLILNKQTPKVTSTKDAHTLLRNDYNLINGFRMFTAMQHNCAGLAANQIAFGNNRINERFFVMGGMVVVCPKILEYIGEPEIMIEGCLTWPGRKIRVERYNKIYVDYYSITGIQVKTPLEGRNAQIFQHEYNHLEGVNECLI